MSNRFHYKHCSFASVWVLWIHAENKEEIQEAARGRNRDGWDPIWLLPSLDFHGAIVGPSRFGRCRPACNDSLHRTNFKRQLKSKNAMKKRSDSLSWKRRESGGWFWMVFGMVLVQPSADFLETTYDIYDSFINTTMWYMIYEYLWCILPFELTRNIMMSSLCSL